MGKLTRIWLRRFIEALKLIKFYYRNRIKAGKHTLTIRLVLWYPIHKIVFTLIVNQTINLMDESWLRQIIIVCLFLWQTQKHTPVDMKKNNTFIAKATLWMNENDYLYHCWKINCDFDYSRHRLDDNVLVIKMAEFFSGPLILRHLNIMQFVIEFSASARTVTWIYLAEKYHSRKVINLSTHKIIKKGRPAFLYTISS